MPITRHDRRIWWAALILLCAALLAPLLLVDVPPLLDYPNHLARMVLLAWPQDPVLSRLATPHWAIIPDLAIDLVLPPLLHILPVHVAGRIVVAVVMLLPMLGAIAYSRAAFGSRAWWALAASLVAYSGTFLLGFLNFTASIGIALLLAAAWIAWRDTRPVASIVLATLGTSVLFFCHLMGLLFFAVLIGSFELECLWRRGLRILRPALAAATFLPASALYLLSPLAETGGTTEFPSLHDKLRALLTPVINYQYGLDIVTAAFIGLLPALLLLTGRARTRPCTALPIAALLLLFAAAPTAAKGAQNIDTRFLVMASLLLFAGIAPARLPKPATLLIVGGFGLLFVTRMIVLALAWHGSAADVAALRRVIASVQPGDAVFVTDVSPQEAPAYWAGAPAWRRLSSGQRVDAQMPALLLVERHAFWPFLFDNESQQPIVQRPAYRALALRVGAMPEHHAFLQPGAVDVCGFDHVLLLDAGGEPDLAQFAADRLTLIDRADFAALFRVTQGAADPPCAP